MPDDEFVRCPRSATCAPDAIPTASTSGDSSSPPLAFGSITLSAQPLSRLSASDPHKPRLRRTSMPSADFEVIQDCSALSPAGRLTNLPVVSLIIPSVRERRMRRGQLSIEGFAACQLARCHTYVSGSCPSPRTLTSTSPQSPPHSDALALPLSFGSTSAWTGDSHEHDRMHRTHARPEPRAGHRVGSRAW